jgi:hypothetical protein
MRKFWVYRNPEGDSQIFDSDELKAFLHEMITGQEYRLWREAADSKGISYGQEREYIYHYLRDNLCSLEKKAFVSVKEEVDRFDVEYSKRDLEQIGLMVQRAYKKALGDRALDLYSEEEIGGKVVETRQYLKEKREEIDKTIVRFYRRKLERLMSRDMSEATEKSMAEHNEMVDLCKQNIRKVKLTINPRYPREKLYFTRSSKRNKNGNSKKNKVQLESQTGHSRPRRRRRPSQGYEKI